MNYTVTYYLLPKYIAPTMKCLHQLVIHKVAAEWKTIADFLDFESSTINIIQDQCRDNPTKCCAELFREWLDTDCGLQPKTWSTLFVALKNVKQLATATEEIEQKLKSKLAMFYLLQVVLYCLRFQCCI